MSKLFTSLADAMFRWPRTTLLLAALATAALGYNITGLKMFSSFPDLLPQGHPYVKLHNQIKDQFGGANVITLAMVVDEGTILTNENLKRLFRLTQKIDTLPGVNHNLVSSLVHRTVRRSWIDANGSMRSAVYFDPNAPALDEQQLAQLGDYIKGDPNVYGLLVSPDMKAALVKAQLNEFGLDYAKTFQALQKVRQEETVPGVTLYASGQPVLIGWTYHYLPEITNIFLVTLVIMLLLLVYYFRRAYGILFPLLSTVLSAAWGLGFLGIMGYNVDPLTLVVPFLVSARALSHSVQMVERYYEETKLGLDGPTSARNAFNSLFKPGLLAIISDAFGIFLISLGTIPLNDKMAYYCSFWAMSITLTVLVVVPVFLSFLPVREPPPKLGLRLILPKLAGFVTSHHGARTVVISGLLLMVAGVYFSSWVKIGENRPGSPILYPDHDYNVSSSVINEHFPGSEELYIIATTDKEGDIKRPEVLHAIEDFQHYMLLDPEVGATKALPDMVKRLNRLVHGQDPRWAQIPVAKDYVGGLMFAYMATNAIPNALKEFVTSEDDKANVVFYLKDHQGATIKRTLDRVKEWQGSDAAQVEGFGLQLAGGIIGVTAAINEEVWDSNNKVLPSVLGFVFLSVLLFYRSLHAGILMFITMAFATVLTHAFMGIKGIGMNINTIPVIAIGIGVGIDYAIYFMDRVKELMEEGVADVREACYQAMCTTGLAITFTATTLVLGVAIWIVMSSMRFQADAATLLVSMMTINMVAAMMFVPAWFVMFQPRFLRSATPAAK